MIMELEKSETNNAIIVKLENVREHPNADRLKLATVLGTTVIVGLDAQDGDKVIYFDSNLCLSHKYLCSNNLYSNKDSNENPDVKGYFGKNGKVRAQRFRGELSNGYVAPILSLGFAFEDTLWNQNDFTVGAEFTHVNGFEVCKKFLVPQKMNYGSGGSRRKAQPEVSMFRKHWKTKHLMREHLMREKHLISPGKDYIEENFHGTSGRVGRVLVDTNRPWWKFWVPKKEWRVMSGTRNVSSIDFHLPKIRKEIENKVKPHLRKGEILYFEIFGYCGLAPIQVLKNHIFDYGCEPGEYKVMLYRVTMTTEDDFCVDLSREQVYRRAEELGLETPILIRTDFVYYHPLEATVDLGVVPKLAQGDSYWDDKTMLEGIVVWFPNIYGTWSCLKLKSPEFLMLEDQVRNEGVNDVEDLL
jgi:hypothetical protein